jgi:hypothetical protein
MPSNTRYNRQGNSDGGIGSRSGSGKGSSGSSRNKSNTALQSVVARLPLKSLLFDQSPEDFLNGTGWIGDERMRQRDSHNILLSEFGEIDPKHIQSLVAFKNIINNSSMTQYDALRLNFDGRDLVTKKGSYIPSDETSVDLSLQARDIMYNATRNLQHSQGTSQWQKLMIATELSDVAFAQNEWRGQLMTFAGVAGYTYETISRSAQA